MRWFVAALAAVVVLSGCASPEAGQSARGVAGGEGFSLDPLQENATSLHLLRFAGGDIESSLAFEVSFGPSDFCFFSGQICGSAVKRSDITAAVPAGVPVELSLKLSGPGNLGLQLETTDATLLQYEQSYDAGTYRLHASLVRATAGTVVLAVHYYMPSIDSAQGMTLTGLAHSIARSGVVPSFVPVAVELGPGDILNATGDGLEQLVVFPPRGQPLRALVEPFQLEVPEDYPAGTYLVLAEADEAVRLRGPADRTLTAHLLEFVWTEPVDLQVGQETTWDMPLAGHPLHVGLVVVSKPSVDGSSVAAFPGNFDLKLTSPANFDVLADRQDCTLVVSCGVVVVGYSSYGYVSDLLDERLVPGIYKGAVTMESGRDMQAYSWAVIIR